MKTIITANWQGNFKEGTGQLTGEQSPLHRVAIKPVFAKTKATTPEELLGSAHASCFTLTLSYILTEAGIKAESLETTVDLTINNNVITNSDLRLMAKIPDLNEEHFQELALKAKDICAVGNALNVEIGLTATLVPK